MAVAQPPPKNNSIIMKELKKIKFKSKLEVTDLFVKVPMNFKCLLTNTERDFLEAVIHLQSLGKYNTSDSLIMANSGLNSRQITEAKRNLVALGLISVIDNKSLHGSRYSINVELYNDLLKRLNSIRSAIERFEVGDEYRRSKGMKPISKNIINTLRRRLKTVEVPSKERITMSTPYPQQSTKEGIKEILKRRYEEGQLTPEQYHVRLRKIDN